jgi:GalNAc-alpha-(1->4)-GalNAc-alpha-(1->3)-diNAcBac-PP-undecaprenol alpha-1,4-N-acetyl-D-galactosaminyltransferase
MNVVALLIDSLGPGGAQRQIVNLAVGLKKRDYNVVIIVYHKHQFFDSFVLSHKIKIVELKRKGVTDLGFILRLRNILLQYNAHCLIAFLFIPSGYALLMKLLLPKLRVIVSERSFEENTKVIHKIFPRGIYFLADFITANSFTQTEVLRNKFPILKNRIIWIPNGVFCVSVNREMSNSLRVLGLGRVSELKATKLLIYAVASYKLKYPSREISVVWLGSKFDTCENDNSYYLECENLVNQYRLSEQWIWTGAVNDVDRYLSNSDILVHMSRGEGFPNSICEAMMSGVCVIASDVSDHARIIDSGKNGFLVEVDDIEGIVDAIDRYHCLSLCEKISLSQSAMYKAKNEFDMERFIQNYISIIENV